MLTIQPDPTSGAAGTNWIWNLRDTYKVYERL